MLDSSQIPIDRVKELPIQLEGINTSIDAKVLDLQEQINNIMVEINALKARRHIVEMVGNSESGYILYNDGWIEQWGYTTTTGSDVNMRVVFHKTMKDNRFQVFVNMQWNGDGTASWQYLNCHNLDATGFEIVRQASTPHNWKCWGYIA